MHTTDKLSAYHRWYWYHRLRTTALVHAYATSEGLGAAGSLARCCSGYNSLPPCPATCHGNHTQHCSNISKMYPVPWDTRAWVLLGWCGPQLSQHHGGQEGEKERGVQIPRLQQQKIDWSWGSRLGA